ncbi:anhydro-N-acetylmuramic acid kinase [Gelidibacter maritimus]|uniref:Anhydro-N-acetylmuramic acid kinase n=1 Tax=Gelidibacter maritimus TaxID=2761487 RepID=A0A7W2M8I9_9FLAO|nr:anhydro-N-acetylmuramic acid kinase [Gelidibacter maritimus]MBA6154506.1 anhydro-N-acetylmuramic acid kinase [Gelidibacter maritimus]
MIKNYYNVIGVMSGTSLDGIDIAHCSFTHDHQWNFEILQAETYDYPSAWVEKLKNLVTMSEAELLHLDEEYTRFLGSAIQQFISKHKLSKLDAVCSHGHTALHQPQSGLTYQIGNLAQLATILNETVVCDFRVADVALGGQGAPLVPIGDQLLFPQYDFCLNFGGFANISSEINGRRIAYDVCPVNIVLNLYANKLGLDYDDGGKIAASGTIHQVLLNQLNALSFYKTPYPKSLGLEWVKTEIFPLIDSFALEGSDVLRTFIEHIAIQISQEINSKIDVSVLATGGGAFNTFLMACLSDKTQNVIIIPDKLIVNYKEALIFAFLGVLRLRNENNCLSSVTGAKMDHSSGQIYYP